MLLKLTPEISPTWAHVAFTPAPKVQKGSQVISVFLHFWNLHIK